MCVYVCVHKIINIATYIPAEPLDSETAEMDQYTYTGHHSDCPETATCHLLTVHIARRRETLERPPLEGDRSRWHAAIHCIHHTAPLIHRPGAGRGRVGGRGEREREKEGGGSESILFIAIIPLIINLYTAPRYQGLGT